MNRFATSHSAATRPEVAHPGSVDLSLAQEPIKPREPSRREEPLDDPAELLRPVHLLLAAGAVLFVALLALGPVPIVDLWWQMKAGQLILEHGSVPRTDPFSFTSGGAEWIVHEWLPALFFYWLYTFVSPQALVVYKMVGASVAFGLVLWRCVRRTNRWLLSAAVTVLAALAARTFLDIRPQILTYIFFAGLLLILEEYRRRTRNPAEFAFAARLLWVVPPLMLLWANLHAGFLLGFFALGVYLLGEGWEVLRGDRSRLQVARALAIALGVSIPVTLLQPNGFALWRYPFVLMGHDTVMGFILEWKSPNFHQRWVRPYELLLLLALASFALSRRSIWAGDLIFLVLLVHASLTSIRHIPVFALACAPIVATPLAQIVGRVERSLKADGRFGRTAFLATGLALVTLAFGFAAELRGLPRRDWFSYTGALRGFPVAACDAIEVSGWKGNLFNDYKWGGYCLWRFYPERKVFIDGRAEVYFDTAFDDYYAIHNVFPDWAERLRKWRVDTALLDRQSYLARVMETSPEWVRVYHDPVALIFRRREPFSGRPSP